MAETDFKEIICRLAERLGQGTVHPRVIGRFSNVVVALDPLPIVARIATGTALLRDPRTYAQREVEIAAFLSHACAPVVSPCDAELAGPHEVDGWTISLWSRVDLLPGTSDAAEAGRRLSQCHAILRGWSGNSPYLEFFPELDRLLEHPLVLQAGAEEDRRLVAQQARICKRSLESYAATFQPVHGDAHRKNVFHTAAGPLWADWEDTVQGPIEWDLACLVVEARVTGSDGSWAEAALAAYGPYNAEALQMCVHARALFAVGWLWLLASDPLQDKQRIVDRQQRLSVWLAWVRANRLDSSGVQRR